jgi:hypothetical protein
VGVALAFTLARGAVPWPSGPLLLLALALTAVVAAVLAPRARGSGPLGRLLAEFYPLVLTGSFYPNAEEAIRELKKEGWRHLGAVSVRLFNPFPEEELAETLSQAQVVTVLDRSNSFGSVPPLASRVINALARKGRETMPVFRTVVGGLGGREITVAQLKELMKFSFLMLSPASQPELNLRRQLLEQDAVIQGMLTEVASLEERNLSRHQDAKATRGAFQLPIRPASLGTSLPKTSVGNYARLTITDRWSFLMPRSCGAKASSSKAADSPGTPQAGNGGSGSAFLQGR